MPVAWLREFVDLPASATVQEIASRIAAVGFEVAGIEGDVIDFEVTANRPDCLSVVGVARELSALSGAPFRSPAIAVKEGEQVIQGALIALLADESQAEGVSKA